MFLHLKIPFRSFFCNRLQLLFLVLFLPLFTLAQEQTVTGQVKDKANTPLEGVTVVIKGTSAHDLYSTHSPSRASSNPNLSVGAAADAPQEFMIGDAQRRQGRRGARRIIGYGG